MKLQSFIFGMLCCLLLWTFGGADATPTSDQGDDAEVRALLHAKRDLLAERHEFLKAMRKEGRGTHDAVLEAYDLVLSTELELATTEEQRSAIHKKRIKNFQLLEVVATDKFNAGTADISEKQLAAANRIQAEIDAHRDIAGWK